MSEASSDNSAPRQYALIELVRLMTEGGRPTTLGALKEACRSGALPSREVRGALVVHHDDFMAWLKGPHRAPGPGEAGQDPAVLAREALAELKTRLKVERSRRLGDSDETRGEDEAASAGADRAEEVADPDCEAPGGEVSEEDLSPSPQKDAGGGGASLEGAVPADGKVAGAAGWRSAASAAASAEVEGQPGGGECPPSGERLAESEGASDEDAPCSGEQSLEEEIEGPRGLVNTFSLERLEDGTTRRHGPCSTRYPDGARAAEGHYRHGRLHGPWKQWFANGTLQCEGGYKDGLQDGRWVVWDASGNRLQEGDFHLGEARGLWREYHGNGKLWRECHYDRGIVTGEVHYFDADGMPLENDDPSHRGGFSPEETS